MVHTETVAHHHPLSWKHSTLNGVGGVIISLLIAVALTLLPDDRAILVLAVFVGILSGVYFGVALSPTGTRNTVMNMAMALVFVVFALLGAWVSPMFFALACFTHAAWDVVIDHPRALNEPIARWYMPLCVGSDVALGIFIAIWFS